MPALGRDTASTQASETADLEHLAARLAGLGLHADLHAPDGGLPYLEVRNPRADILSERVYVLAGGYWWAERLTGRDQAGLAASILAGVLRSPSACTP
jgi:hypothetical protein